MPAKRTTDAPTVIVVAYRCDVHLRACLERLGGELRVLVVDNDAAAGEAEAIAEAADAEYAAAPGNVGFAAAVNLGLARWDGSSDVLLLNPDARASAADVLRLHAALHAPGARRAAVGPRLVDPDGTAQRAEWPLPSPAQVWCDALGLARRWRGPTFVVGAALLLAGAALAEVGGLDERYFLYAEEADWQLRALRAGWTVAVAEDVCVEHAGAASSTDRAVREQLFHASAEAFARRWYGRVGWFAMRAGALLAAVRRSLTGSADARASSRRVVRLYLRGPSRARRR